MNPLKAKETTEASALLMLFPLTGESATSPSGRLVHSALAWIHCGFVCQVHCGIQYTCLADHGIRKKPWFYMKAPSGTLEEEFNACLNFPCRRKPCRLSSKAAATKTTTTTSCNSNNSSTNYNVAAATTTYYITEPTRATCYITVTMQAASLHHSSVPLLLFLTEFSIFLTSRSSLCSTAIVPAFLVGRYSQPAVWQCSS